MQAWPPLTIEGKFASQHGSTAPFLCKGKSEDQMCLILCSIFLAKKIRQICDSLFLYPYSFRRRRWVFKNAIKNRNGFRWPLKPEQSNL
ncbi:unnamed protein product [Prunus armeniaca]